MKKKDFVLILVAVVVVVLIACTKVADAHLENFVQVEKTVQQGDTLWGYAEEYCGEEVRKQDYIDAVLELNGRTTSTLYPGETIILLEAEK